MATMSNLQDFNSLNNQMQMQYLQPQQKKDVVLSDISNAISGTMNAIPNVMSEQRENFKFQFQEVLGCLNLMESQGIIKINRQEEIYVEEEKAGIKEVAITVAIIWGLIKLGMLIAL